MQKNTLSSLLLRTLFLAPLLGSPSNALAQEPSKECAPLLRPSIQLDQGIEITGKLKRIIRDSEGSPVFIQLEGPSRISRRTDGKLRLIPGQGEEQHPHGYSTPIGFLSDHRFLGDLSDQELATYTALNQKLRLVFRSGIVVEGVLKNTLRTETGKILLLTFEDCKVTYGDELLFDPSWGVYDLVLCGIKSEGFYAFPDFY